MTKWKRANPTGTRDLFFEDSTLQEEVEQRLRRVFISRGYEEIRTPTIEFYDVFSFQNRPIDEERMYKFFDHRGRILVLRPDMTIPIARVVGTTMMKSPLKLTYSGNIFRANKSLAGKYNELTQAGIEIIGIDNLRAEVECIVSAITALQAIGVSQFKIEIGQVELYKSIIKKLSLTENDEIVLRSYIENKSYTGLTEFLKRKNFDKTDATIRLLQRLPRLFGGIEIVEEAERLATNKEMKQAIVRVRQIYETIARLGYGNYVSVDLGMVQNLQYYTGVIFRGYANDVGEEIVSGGRYDDLMGHFGEPLPAVGLALQVDQIVRVLKEQMPPAEVEPAAVLIHYALETIEEAERLRSLLGKDGVKAELSMCETLQESFHFARRHGVQRVIDTAGDRLAEYEWKEKWQLMKEGETSCVTFKLR
ncbi:ATP phosphoribosyltransferase regulatory subunit [Ectobacillus sp. JY-23]|uniref:ATP phosphoribosyltransferase regulatory subunit n=1 Tax=Ectobacillus sp. JY-23 TaxID=2933872 RepID=UPI001FF2FA1A|nr:ATP phosphoribosyltransferase regulatory subunit [Ectobacillus sp. JY-23]UOY93259.1 ATP phosphoribosyltransferase regulatory subunit [Ectobacillus sp. JY-23]